MKLPHIIVAILATSLLIGSCVADERTTRKRTRRSNRVARQTSADQMVQNILKWLQGVYTQQSRRSRFADHHNLFNFASGKLDDAFRQGTLREYLPPTNTQKPRPFETARPPGGDGIDGNGNYIYGGYPPAGSITPQPPFPIYTRPPSGGVPGDGYPSTIGYPQTTFPGHGTPPRPTGYPTDTAGTTISESYPTPGFPTHAPEGPVPGPGGFTGYPGGQTTPGGFTGFPDGHTTPEGPGGHTAPGGFTGYPGPSTPGGFTSSPGGETTPGFTGYPGAQTTPGATGIPGDQTTPGTTGAPGSQTTPEGVTGYPGVETTPGGITGYPGGQTTPGAPSETPTQQPTTTSAPTEKPGYPEGPGISTQSPPESSTALPGFPTRPPPGDFTGYPTRPPPADFTGYPTRQPDGAGTTSPPELTRTPTQSPETTEAPSQSPEVTQAPSEKPEDTETPSQPSEATETPSGKPEVTEAPSQPDTTEAPATTGRPVGPTEPSSVDTELPTSKPSTGPAVTETFTSATAPESEPTTQSPEVNTIPTDRPAKTTDSKSEEDNKDDDSNHPPHIHSIDVECAKDMMTINLEFNREFNGIIYSKGYYNMPECRYVKENSGQTKYTFTVNLNQCGTEFINAFDTQGQSYLENILVLQNEAGVQEIWDTVRAVRCLWEGNLKETLSVALSVGMLSQELVTFSGDTAVAKLDILLGRGPLGQPANGLVKIGEEMTLVVSVSGDPGFDLQVKDCRATDSTGEKTIPLTDDNGCVLKPKLFGAFQKTRSTGDTGASIIAYAFFNAFKFPDVMDLMIECNIELCKTDCDMCTDPDQKLEPGRRRRRDLYSYNETLHDGVTMGKHLRIILPEDLSDRTVLDLGRNEGVCMSTQSFVFSTALLISLLTASCLFSAYMWLKTQQLKLSKK